MGKFLKKERIMADNEAFDSTNFNEVPKLFGRWTYEDLNISDKTLEIYISVHTSKQKVFVPHTAGRYQLKRFRKASMPLVERLMGTVAYHGRNTGKKLKAMRIVKQALEIIHHHTGVNPLQVVIGAVKRQACDVSSFRRVNQGLYFIATCTRNKGMRTIRHISEILADEIMAAAKNSPNCAAVKKREEIEKSAKANR